MRAVLDGLAQHMHAHGIATYAANGVYPATVTAPAVFFGRLAPGPDLAVAVAHYNTDPDIDTTVNNPKIFVQLRWRGGKDPRTVQDAADAAFAVLHTDTPGIWPGGIRPLWMYRTITAPLEADDNDRWMRADSYEIRLNPGA